SREELIRLLSLKSGEIYFKPTSDADRAKIRAYYGYRGRPAIVHERLTFDRSGKLNVHYDIDEQAPARVGQIIIAGNDVTRDDLIRGQIPAYPGQVLTYPKLRLGEMNLARPSIFDSSSSMSRERLFYDPEGVYFKFQDEPAMQFSSAATWNELT